MPTRIQLWGAIIGAALLGLVLVLGLAGRTPAVAEASRSQLAGAPSPTATAPPARPVKGGHYPPVASKDDPGADLPGAPLRAGGPNSFGYTMADSYEVNGAAYAYTAAANAVSGLSEDDAAKTIALPFTISLYDRSAVTLTISTNGFIYMGEDFCNSQNNYCSVNAPLPGTTAPPGMIAPLWDDLRLDQSGATGGVYTDVRGSSPARTFVVEWRDATFYSDTTSSQVTFQVVLHENSNQIDFQYYSMVGARSSGSEGTVGIQNYAQTTGLQYSMDESVLTSSFAIRYLALISPGYQVKTTPACTTVTYTGRIYNPHTLSVTYGINLSNSDPDFISDIQPVSPGPISPGLSIPFTVTVSTPNKPVGTSNTTTVTVASQTGSFPLSARVYLTTTLTGSADFTPATASQAGVPGQTLTYTTSLYNRTDQPTSFIITAGDNYWPSRVVPSNTGLIAPSAAISVSVYVTIPLSSQAGESDTTVLTATAQLAGLCALSSNARFTTYNGNQVDKEPLPQARARHALLDFTPNGRVYLLGGVGTNNNMNLPIADYDARANLWTSHRALPVPVSNIGAVVLGDTIYVPGGFDGITAIRLLQTYKPSTDETAVSDELLPEARYGAGVVAWGGKMYLIGGSDNVTSTAKVFEFDPARPEGSRWAQKASMPTPRAFLTASVLDNKIYAVGGVRSINNPTDLAVVEVYDPATDTWTTAASLLTPRGGAASVGQDTGQPCGGFLYVYGGGWFTPLATAERYNPATNTWATTAPISVARRNLAATYAQNGHLLLVSGGFNGYTFNTVDAISCGGILPTPTPTPPGGVPTATATPTACPVTFSDVNTTDYFYQPVRYLSCRQIVSGYSDNTFRPYNNMTRGQLTKVVALAQGWTLLNPATPTFSDVPTSNPFYTYIETAARGIIAGYANGTFAPNNEVTRGQIAKIVVGAEGWTLINPSTNTFTDVTTANPFFTFVETAYGHNILSGYSDLTFRPYNTATRGQVSKIVYIALGWP